MLELTPEILAVAIELDEGVARLTRGEQYLAINRMEARIRIQANRIQRVSASSSSVILMSVSSAIIS